MKIIISPAKKMNVDTETAAWKEYPAYLEKTRILLDYMRGLRYEECKKIWKCNDRLAELNFQRFQEMDLEKTLTPAILSYEGLQYQYLSPRVLQEDELTYIQEHLRILSGFYGILKPFDGVVPYRLEMQARLGGEQLDSLYDYWGDTLANHLFSEDALILNLASKEYSKCISAHTKKRPDITFVTCVFGEMVGGKVVEKGTLAKMARGEMVRFLAGRHGESLDQVKEFRGLGYEFCPERSDENTCVFIKREEKQ